MILVAGLSPAWQQIMVFDALRMGQVNRAAEVHWCASGKVLNVGRAVASLGGEQLTLSLAGGPASESAEREFREAGIACRWVKTRQPTRVCSTLIERASGRVTELVENAPAVSLEEVNAFRQAYREEVAAANVVVLTGSLPPGAPATLYRELAEATDAPLLLDIRGAELWEALRQRPLLVKPNREELAATCGRTLESEQELQRAMREVNQRGACWVLVSQGGGEVWLSSIDALYRIEVPATAVVNPIGSGDCLAAGIAWRLASGSDVPEATVMGVAAALENARALMPARLDASRVLQQAAKLTLERIE